MKIREILTKINDAIRPPHVGPLPRTDITALGTTLKADDGGFLAGAESKAAAQQTLGPK